MSLVGKSVWLRAERAIEGVGGAGAALWARPPEVRRAVAELVGVFPVTHLVIGLEAIRDGAGPAPSWKAILGRSEGWSEPLAELTAAIASALRPPCTFGFVLPDPRAVAAESGDGSEKGILKAGLQVASFLQAIRAAGLAFVVLALDANASGDVTRAAAPVLRNAGHYGWRRALEVSSLADTLPPDTDIRLVPSATIAELEPVWSRGEEVGGGLEQDFWDGRGFESAAPASFLLYGAAPAGIDAAGVVGAGRRLRQWVG